ALVLQLFELKSFEGVEPRGAAAGRLRASRRTDDPEKPDLPPEVPLVKALVEDRLVDELQLREREFPREELESHGRVLELVPDTLEGVLENLPVIERERRKRFHRMPPGLRRVASSPEPDVVRRDEREIGDRDHSAARIAAGI